MMARFVRYAEKVFDLAALTRSLTDSREKPQIPTPSVFLCALMMCATRLRSLNALEGELRVPGRWEKIVGPRKPSPDSVARIVDRVDPQGLRDALSKINHRLRRNKVLDESPWALRFVALDGHEFFSQ